MELDKIAQKLGYRDVEHLKMNIENYGEPLSEWWKVMQEIAINTEIIGNVSDCHIVLSGQDHNIEGVFLEKDNANKMIDKFKKDGYGGSYIETHKFNDR